MIRSMFGSLGFPELIFIFLLALLIFGPKKLPELGRTLGKAMAEFRKATTDLKRTINAELIEQELRDADPRKMVRDSLREAKASLENAVRQDDARAAAAAAPAVAAPAASEGVAPGPIAAGPNADPSAPAEPAPAESATGAPALAATALAEEPDPTEPPLKKEPAGAIARGAAFEDEEEPAPEAEAPLPAARS